MTGLKRISTRLSFTSVRCLVAVALLVALTAGLLQWARYAPLRQIDSFFYDSYAVLDARNVAESPVVLVNIDDNSLSEIGQWPWPHYKLAQLISKISEATPSVIGMDVIFPEVDRTGLAALREAYRKEFGLELDLNNIPKALLDNDAYLGSVMNESGVIGAIQLLFDHDNRASLTLSMDQGIHLAGRVDQLQLDEASGLLQNTFRVQSQLKFEGFMNMQPDYDGKVRRIPLLLRFKDKVYPHLLLASLMRMTNTDTVTVERDRMGLLLKVGRYVIPVNADGTMLLRYRSAAQAYQTLSALDVLRGETSAQVLNGHPVFVGSSATGLNDFINTPVATQLPGLNAYAAGLGNMLANQYVREPEWSGAAALALSLLCGGIIAVLFAYSNSVLVLLSGSAGLLAAQLMASGFLVMGAGVYLSPAAEVVTVIACFTLLSVARFAIEKRRAFAWLKLVNNTQRVAIEAMAAVAETRDPETGGHIKRTQNYVKALAEELVKQGKYLEILTPEYIELLYLSAPLHDIGKVGVQDNILLKPGRLDMEEFEKMKKHASFGENIITATSKNIKGENFLHIAGEIAGYHHEYWDGSGYPYGLAGAAIPLSARLMAVADVYDALISKRCYKAAFSHKTARHVLLKRRGRQFDPDVIDAFFAIEKEIIAIAQRYTDELAIQEFTHPAD